MRGPPGRGVAVTLALMALAGCELLPQGPLTGLPAAEPLPQRTESWFELGTELLVAGRPDQAEDAFIRSMRVEGMTAAAFNGAGVAAQRQGLLTEAIRYFEHAKRLDPASVAAHNNLGAALYALGEIEAARHAFRTAFALSSGTSEQAAQNLNMADLAIAAAEEERQPAARDRRKLQRVGSAEYKLIGTPATAGSG